MNYVDSFNLFGVEVKEIPCIKGSGAPTSSTEGAVGLFYMDTASNTKEVYKCVATSNGVYTWVNICGENGNSGGSVEGAVLYTEQELTEEQKAQARKNIGAVSKEEAEQIIIPEDTPGALSAKQINALDALFKAASYIKDVSAEYAAFCDAFGLTEPDEPDEPDVPDVVIPSVKQGSVSFDTGKMGLNGTMTNRATLIPIGQYLKKGATYKFSIGNAESSYVYGVQIFVADSPALEFPHANEVIFYDGVSEQLVDSGWIAKDYTYTVDKNNCILAVNFRKSNYANMSDSDYAVLFEAFTIEEQAQPDALSIKQGTISFTSNGKMAMSGTANTRATLVPLGQYLEKGKTYRFGLGNISDKYYYGVQVFVAESADMVFPYVAGVVTNYDGISERLVDSGWKNTDYVYAVDKDNCILAVNFKGNPEIVFNDGNYTEILENFVFEEIEQ